MLINDSTEPDNLVAIGFLEEWISKIVNLLELEKHSRV